MTQNWGMGVYIKNNNNSKMNTFSKNSCSFLNCPLGQLKVIQAWQGEVRLKYERREDHAFYKNLIN